MTHLTLEQIVKTELRILSLGAGVQSSTLALMIEHGEVERVDCAIFADTGWEPKSVYTWLGWLESQLSYPVYRVSNGNIRASLTGTQARYAAIPFFTEDRGMALRQCTNEYKLVPIKRKVRELLGLEKGERANGKQATMLIGISTDESQRMKPAQEAYMENEWPLIDARMSRSDCLQWMARNGIRCRKSQAVSAARITPMHIGEICARTILKPGPMRAR